MCLSMYISSSFWYVLMYNLQDQLHNIKLYIIWQIEKVTKLQNVIKKFAISPALVLLYHRIYYFHKGQLAVTKSISSILTQN